MSYLQASKQAAIVALPSVITLTAYALTRSHAAAGGALLTSLALTTLKSMDPSEKGLAPRLYRPLCVTALASTTYLWTRSARIHPLPTVATIGISSVLSLPLSRTLLRAFRQSFQHASAEETRLRTKQHNLTRYKPWEPMQHAAWKGNHHYIDTLLSSGKLSVNEKNVEEVTALHCAALSGQITTVLKLIAKGADVNSRDMRGQTPLYWAAWAGHASIIQILSKHGAQIDERDDRNKTPLRAAAKYGRIDAMISLNSLGANLNAEDSKKQTPYFVACLQGRVKALNLLRNLGANTEIINIDNKTTSAVMGRAGLKAYLRLCFSRVWHDAMTDDDIRALHSKK
jgi:hypothetical protein